jgi:hypothetical protein
MRNGLKGNYRDTLQGQHSRIKMWYKKEQRYVRNFALAYKTTQLSMKRMSVAENDLRSIRSKFQYKTES